MLKCPNSRLYKPSSFSESETGPNIQAWPHYYGLWRHILRSVYRTWLSIILSSPFVKCHPIEIIMMVIWVNMRLSKTASIIDDKLPFSSLRPGCTWWLMFSPWWLFGGLWLRARFLVHDSLVWFLKRWGNSTSLVYVGFLRIGTWHSSLCLLRKLHNL